jgi:hypothetical protein
MMRLLYGEISDTIAEKIVTFLKVARLGADFKMTGLAVLPPKITRLQASFILT